LQLSVNISKESISHLLKFGNSLKISRVMGSKILFSAGGIEQGEYVEK
jgi:hypothetical protein